MLSGKKQLSYPALFLGSYGWLFIWFFWWKLWKGYRKSLHRQRQYWFAGKLCWRCKKAQESPIGGIYLSGGSLHYWAYEIADRMGVYGAMGPNRRTNAGPEGGGRQINISTGKTSGGPRKGKGNMGCVNHRNCWWKKSQTTTWDGSKTL